MIIIRDDQYHCGEVGPMTADSAGNPGLRYQTLALLSENSFIIFVKCLNGDDSLL